MKIELNYYLIIWLIMISISSCINNSNLKDAEVFQAKDGSFMVRTFREDGSVKTDAMFNADSLLHGKLISYYATGETKVEKNYTNGEKDGITRGFFPNGNIEYIGKYSNDQKDSTWLWYSLRKKDSKLDAIENYLHGKHFGGQIGFTSSGEIKWYKLFNLEGLLGKISSRGGEPKIEGKLYFIWFNRDTLNKNEEFLLNLYAGAPPGWNSKLKLNLVDVTNEVEINKYCDLVKTRARLTDKYLLSCSMEKRGSFLFKGILEIINEQENKSYNDTLEMEIIVK